MNTRQDQPPPYRAEHSHDADSLAAWPLERGRGYRPDSVEQFRDAALTTVRELEVRLEEAVAAYEAERRSGTISEPDPVAIAMQLTGDQLRRAGYTAIGATLSEARERANAVLADASRRVARQVEEAVALLEAARDELRVKDGDSYQASQLRLGIGRAIEGLKGGRDLS